MGSRAEQRTYIASRRTERAGWANIVSECRTKWGLNARQVLRVARGLSQQQVADEWCRRWPDDPKTFKNISTWERWPEKGHEPSLVVLDCLAQIYCCAVADLVSDLGDYGFQIPLQSGDDPQVDRRTLLTGLGSAIAAQTATRHLPPSARTIGPGTLEYLAEQLVGHWQVDRSYGSAVLLDTVAVQADTMLAAVERTRGGDHRRCLGLATAYTGFLAWLYQDAGNIPSCTSWLAHTLELAHRSSDPELIAYALSSKALVCVDVDDGQGAIEFASAALRISPNLKPKAQVMALQHAAHGHAIAGNRREVDRLLDRMHATLDQMATDNQPWGGDRFHRSPDHIVITHRATCYGRLGLGADAAQLWTQVRRYRRPDERRDIGIHIARHVNALLDSDEPDEAARQASADTALLTNAASARMRHELTQLHDRAMRYSTTRAGRDLLDIVAAITT